jgi:HEAT repeat protein
LTLTVTAALGVLLIFALPALRSHLRTTANRTTPPTGTPVPDHRSGPGVTDGSATRLLPPAPTALSAREQSPTVTAPPTLPTSIRNDALAAVRTGTLADPPDTTAAPLSVVTRAAAPAAPTMPNPSADQWLAALRSEADPSRRAAAVAQLERHPEQVRESAPALYRVFLTDRDARVARAAQEALRRLGVQVMEAAVETSVLVAAADLGKRDFDAADDLWRDPSSRSRRLQIAESLARLAPPEVCGPWLYRMCLTEPDTNTRRRVAQLMEVAGVDIPSCRTVTTAAIIAEQIATGRESAEGDCIVELGLHKDISPETVVILGEALAQGRGAAADALAAIDTVPAVTAYLGALQNRRALSLDPEACSAMVHFRRQFDHIVAYAKGLDAVSQERLWSQLVETVQRRPQQAGDAVAVARLLATIVSTRIDPRLLAAAPRAAIGARPASITPGDLERRIGRELDGGYGGAVVAALGKLLGVASGRLERLACVAILRQARSGHDAVVAALAQALCVDSDASVRWAAVAGLAGLRYAVDIAGPALQRGLLTDRDVAVRLACAQTLAVYGDGRAERPLRQAADRDESALVRDAAKRALAMLTATYGLNRLAPKGPRGRDEDVDFGSGPRADSGTGLGGGVVGGGFGGIGPTTPTRGGLFGAEPSARRVDPNEAWKDRRKRYWDRIGAD